MNLNDYQAAALRTAFDDDGNLSPPWYLALGLAGEAGEVADLVKKVERHGKPFDRDELRAELGDVLWYVATLAARHGIDLDDVASSNIAKLRERYPEGFRKRFGHDEGSANG